MKSECALCYKLFANSDQDNECLKKHPVCLNCLGKLLFKFYSHSSPVCREEYG